MSDTKTISLDPSLPPGWIWVPRDPAAVAREWRDEVRRVAMLCLEVHTGTGAEAAAIVERVMAEWYGNP